MPSMRPGEEEPFALLPYAWFPERFFVTGRACVQSGRKGTVWYTLAATQEPKMEILAKFHLSASGERCADQFEQNRSYILLGVK